MPKTIGRRVPPAIPADRTTWPTNLTPALLVAYLENIVTEKTLMNWRSAGEGPPFIRVGGSILYRLTSVDRWLDGMERLNGAAAA